MKVILPDGTELELADGATGADAARAIGAGLARAALGDQASNGELRDLGAAARRRRPDRDRHRRATRTALELIRHDAAHVLADGGAWSSIRA